mmetsp:Transcript_40775/g.105416  ORF Transcript_40775/g.105416 Transcript_40775/m.105416 type:complete len:281 (+) Transcript_40775:1487-2329(+)
MPLSRNKLQPSRVQTEHGASGRISAPLALQHPLQALQLEGLRQGLDAVRGVHGGVADRQPARQQHPPQREKPVGGGGGGHPQRSWLFREQLHCEGGRVQGGRLVWQKQRHCAPWVAKVEQPIAVGTEPQASPHQQQVLEQEGELVCDLTHPVACQSLLVQARAAAAPNRAVAHLLSQLRLTSHQRGNESTLHPDHALQPPDSRLGSRHDLSTRGGKKSFPGFDTGDNCLALPAAAPLGGLLACTPIGPCLAERPQPLHHHPIRSHQAVGNIYVVAICQPR